MAPKSRLSTTSTRKWAKCFSGSQSRKEGGKSRSCFKLSERKHLAMAASYSQTILWKATFLILLANFCESISDRLLEEAVKVIGLYQDQQSFDLKPESKSIIKTVGLSAREKALGDQYETTNQSIGDIESQIMHIRPCANIKVDESQAAKIVELETKKSSAIDAYLAFYNGMKHELLKDPDGTDAVPSEKEVKIFQSSLEAIGIETKQNTTGLYTLIGDRNFHLVTVFPDRIMSFVTPIKSDNFEKKIWEFYELLQSDEYDTRILGKELYDIILKPAEAELKKHRTQTLLWSLDGKLRYVPMSALSPNGLTYLASQYQSVNFTRSETGRITKPVSAFMNGTGFGSSKAHTVAFGDGESIYLGALRSMNGELMGIFKNPTDDAGFVTGALFTDEQFTKANFFEALRQHRPLVHISSHFVFREGDDEHSFLLLGDGTTLTL